MVTKIPSPGFLLLSGPQLIQLIFWTLGYFFLQNSTKCLNNSIGLYINCKAKGRAACPSRIAVPLRAIYSVKNIRKGSSRPAPRYHTPPACLRTRARGRAGGGNSLCVCARMFLSFLCGERGTSEKKKKRKTRHYGHMSCKYCGSVFVS